MSSKKDHLAAEKRLILQAAYPLVPAGGWTEDTLRTATLASGLDAGTAIRAFPGGVSDLVDFSIAEADRQMIEALPEATLAELRIRERITLIVRTRLEQAFPHREAVRRTLAYYSLPQHAARGLKTLAHTASEMWYLAGDTSTDYNWYTKRMLLAGVYMSTLLFWLNDESENQEDTWAFLDRRIGDVMQIEKAKGRVKAKVASLNV